MQLGVEKTYKIIENYRYQINALISKESSSRIFLGHKQNTHETVAIKVVNLKNLSNKKLKDMLYNEIDSFKTLQHPNLVSCYDILETKNNCYIVMEFCNQGDLENLLSKRGKLQEHQALSIFRDLLTGYKYMMDKKVLHRDLKPINILIKDKVIKIADFSFSKKNKQLPIIQEQFVGTFEYLSPEALAHHRFTVKNDIWAIGIILYKVLHANHPWLNQKITNQQYIKIMTTHPLEINKKYSEDLRDFIRKCLTIDQKSRLNELEFSNHPFFLRICSQDSVHNSRLLHKGNSNNDINSNKHGEGNKKMHLKSKTEKQFTAQINYMRFIFRFLQMFPSFQQSSQACLCLKFLATKQMLCLIFSLKKCLLQDQNNFNFEYWDQFLLNSQKVESYKKILQDYQQRYQKIKNFFESSLIGIAKKQASLHSQAETSYNRSQSTSILSIKYALFECRHMWEEMKKKKQKISPQAFEAYFAIQALRLDFTITFYQLNCILIEDYANPEYFSKNSSIDLIIDFKPTILMPSFENEIQQKLKMLQII